MSIPVYAKDASKALFQLPDFREPEDIDKISIEIDAHYQHFDLIEKRTVDGELACIIDAKQSELLAFMNDAIGEAKKMDAQEFEYKIGKSSLRNLRRRGQRLDLFFEVGHIVIRRIDGQWNWSTRHDNGKFTNGFQRGQADTIQEAFQEARKALLEAVTKARNQLADIEVCDGST